MAEGKATWDRVAEVVSTHLVLMWSRLAVQVSPWINPWLINTLGLVSIIAGTPAIVLWVATGKSCSERVEVRPDATKVFNQSMAMVAY